jgi:hypothetical protein
MILRRHARRASFERTMEALEIAGCGVATCIAAFALGLHHTAELIAIYAATVGAAYTIMACLERMPPLPQAGND